MYRTIRLITHALWDGIVPYLIAPSNPTGYAFLVHPRDITDVQRKYPFAKYFSESTVLRFIKGFWPITVSKIDGASSLNTQKAIDGWVISIPVTAKQMMDDREVALKHIIKAAKLAKKKGAQIIGLGALTASLSRGGIDIKKAVDINITTGRIYTSHIVTETALKAMRETGIPIDKVKVGVVGAAGSIGTACAQILALQGVRHISLIDISSKHSKVEQVHRELISTHPHITVDDEYDLGKLSTCDVIIAATNHPEALIKSEHVKQEAIIVDDAQPSDVDEEIFINRKDVLALEGGVVHAPKINTHFNFGLKHKTDIFSCLAEAIILASLDHRSDFQVGTLLSVSKSDIDKISDAAKMLGFTVGHFQNDLRLYTDEDIEYVRNIVKNRYN
jgi:predicted amino acid dehydrogenase